MKRPKVSICVPIYNVENYIERCLRSLFEQTLDDIEYIFVDDCTPDNSIGRLKEVLTGYPNRISQTKIIHHNENQTQSGALKTAFTNATGEYLISCDPDDWVELDMYEKLYLKAKETDADVVCCDHYIEKYSNRKLGISHYEGGYEERMGAWIRGKYAAYSWATLVHFHVYQHMQYLQCEYVEDAVRACQVLYYGNKYSYIAEPLYHYRCEGQGATSFSKVEKTIKLHMIAYPWIFDFIHQKFDNKYDEDILISKLQIKWEWCTNGLHSAFYECWPEVNNSSSLKYLPVSISRKILLWIAFRRYKSVFNIIAKAYRFFQKNRYFLWIK